MKAIANILWVICGGLLISIHWVVVGLILCLSIVGIPFGIQCFKFANLMLSPFGKDIVYSERTGSFLLNVLWIIFFGSELALVTVIIGIIWCFSVVGIPIGLQIIKFAKLALMPFGAKVI